MRSQLRKLRNVVRYETRYLINRLTYKGKAIHAEVPNNREAYEEIFERLNGLGVDTSGLTVDKSDFESFLERSRKVYGSYYDGNLYFREKVLEHYIAAKLLQLNESDIYIDIASSDSPAPAVYEALFGCKCYLQDLKYADGINGKYIGGDAGSMPLETGFANKMALHCSFENFQGDADSRFIEEVDRILEPGGSLCIVPLYMTSHLSNQTDFGSFKSSDLPHFDPGATVYSKRKWNEPFGRFYDVASFMDRVIKFKGNLKVRVYLMENAHEIDSNCYVTFAALFYK